MPLRAEGDLTRGLPLGDPAAVPISALAGEGFTVLVSLLRQPTTGDWSEEHVVVAQAVAEAWKKFEHAAPEQDAEAEAAREVLASYDPAELAALCTAVSPHPLMWHVPAVISTWPDQPAVQEFADKLIHDTGPITSGIADTIPVATRAAYVL